MGRINRTGYSLYSVTMDLCSLHYHLFRALVSSVASCDSRHALGEHCPKLLGPSSCASPEYSYGKTWSRLETLFGLRGVNEE
jgi:hypothetical protein